MVIEVLTDPHRLGGHEAAHAAVFRNQGRRPIKVTVSPKKRTYTAVDLTETTTVEFSGRTTTAASGTRLENIDAFLAGYLQDGFTIDQMLAPRVVSEGGGDGDDGEVERALRDRHDVQQALIQVSEHLNKERTGPEVASLLAERAATVIEILVTQSDFIAAATLVVAGLCNHEGRRTCDDLEAAVTDLEAGGTAPT